MLYVNVHTLILFFMKLEICEYYILRVDDMSGEKRQRFGE